MTLELVSAAVLVVGFLAFVTVWIVAEVRVAMWVRKPDPDLWVKRRSY